MRRRAAGREAGGAAAIAQLVVSILQVAVQLA
jgi:hypothetical protein